MPPPPKRDKFAALAQQQQNQQVQQQQQQQHQRNEHPVLQPPPGSAADGDPPSLEEVNEVGDIATDPAPAIAPAAVQRSGGGAPPKRDKFAALSARSPACYSSSTGGDTAAAADSAAPLATSSSSAVKRDKFAALAARSGSSHAEAAAGVGVIPAGGPSVAAAPPARRGDKLAAMASRADLPPATGGVSTDASALTSAADGRAELRRRASQRDEAWDDLDRAEALAAHLLGLAQQTCWELARTAVLDPQEDLRAESDEEEDDVDGGVRDRSLASRRLRRLSREYARTLRRVHGLLKPHAALVRAYLPTGASATAPPSQKKRAALALAGPAASQGSPTIARAPSAGGAPGGRYATRVQLRLARQRRVLLQECAALERAPSPTTTTTKPEPPVSPCSKVVTADDMVVEAEESTARKRRASDPMEHE